MLQYLQVKDVKVFKVGSPGLSEFSRFKPKGNDALTDIADMAAPDWLCAGQTSCRYCIASASMGISTGSRGVYSGP